MRALALLLILLAISGCKRKEDVLLDRQIAASEGAAAQVAAQGVRQTGVTVDELGWFNSKQVFRITDSTTGAICYGTTETLRCNFPTTP